MRCQPVVLVGLLAALSVGVAACAAGDVTLEHTYPWYGFRVGVIGNPN
jgi:hypothetical protein